MTQNALQFSASAQFVESEFARCGRNRFANDDVTGVIHCYAAALADFQLRRIVKIHAVATVGQTASTVKQELHDVGRVQIPTPLYVNNIDLRSESGKSGFITDP